MATAVIHRYGIPSTVTAIIHYAFLGCTTKDEDLPDRLQTINDIHRISIPSTVTASEDDTF